MTQQVLTHETPRKATWFELFFDLVFVTSVAGLAGNFAANYTPQGAWHFALLFLVLWWLWLGHAFHSSRFDRDRPDQWALGFVQMLAVIFIAYGAGDAFGARFWAFAGGVAAFKLLLMLAYLREARRPGLARLCSLYAGLYALQAALWAGSIWADEGARLGLWCLAFAVDVVTPFLVAQETHRAPPHPEHLPERFGLFTLILLGETAAAAVHALDHGEVLHGQTLAVGLLGAALGFLFWLGYFHRVQGQRERHVHDAASVRRLQLWAYGHVPLYLGIAALGAGTVFLAHHPDPHGAEPFLYTGGTALAMLGVTLVSLANTGRGLASGLAYLPLALLATLVPLALHGAVVLGLAMVALAMAQIGLSILQARRS